MTKQPVTYVNVLDVEPERQQELLDLLTRSIENVIRHRPGHISQTLLASLDGRRVVNIARWASIEDTRATQADPQTAEQAAGVAEIATATPGLYRVITALKT
ncbi:MAG: antibiotic biosynthesis monooxygenase [Solirubrobacterales bacterium]|nr:antibiotic biosynthesis monooxygenase [Solirubrobacterales bacterium]